MGKNCVVEKAEDQCCPTISCPPGKYLVHSAGRWWVVVVYQPPGKYVVLLGGGGISTPRISTACDCFGV